MVNPLTREEKNKYSKKPSPHPAVSDPWQTASAATPGEQGNWLLSYLDVMTLLFTFFVLLFAYQRTLSVMDAKPVPVADLSTMSAAPAHAVVAVGRHQDSSANAAASDSARSSDTLAHGEPAVASLASAIATMRSQSAMREIARDVKPKKEVLEEILDKPAELKSSWEARLSIERPAVANAASERTSKQLASLLSSETAKRRLDVIRTAHEIRLELNDAILFDRASTALRAEGAALLDRLLLVLNAQAGILSVEGHTDPVPIANARFPSNWELSSARATAVARHLIRRGIPPERLRAVGMADTQPRDSNQTAEGRAKNRRVSLVIHVDDMGSHRAAGS